MRIRTYKTVLDTKTHMAYLVQEKGFNYNGTMDGKCNNSGQVADMMRVCYDIHRETEECVYLICFDTKRHLIGTFLISRGTANSSMVVPREIMIKALLCNATQFMLIHNHPSQVAEPSDGDKNVTERVRQAAKLIGLDLMEHIIVCEDTYYSFRENGYL